MVRTNQGGSILSFAVLGGIMALLLIGGAYFVRNNLVPAQREPQVATSDEDDGSQERPSDTGASAPDTAAPEENKDKTEEAAPKPEPDTVPEAADNGSTTTDAPHPAPDPAENDHVSGNLPTTGPSGVFLGGFVLSGIVAMGVAYVRSRRLGPSL